MKKIFFVSLLCMAVSGLFSEMSIKDVLNRFNEKLAQNRIPKAEVVIGSIYFGETETNGTAATWMKDEIAKAAVKMRRITIVRDTLKTIQSETQTRGLIFPTKKTKSLYKKKYTISGKYIENKTKGIVSLTLYLEISEGEKTEVFACETATIQSSELKDYGYTLYPQNIAQVENIEKDFKEAETIIECDKTESSGQKKETVKKTMQEEKSQAIQITAYMLDKKDNIVDTLRPGDVVKFLVATDKDAYIKIMGIDAEGNTFWLPIKNNFIKANTVRTFPDDDTMDYQVVDGVFGAEHLFIYVATDETGLPNETEDEKYHPSLISNTTRGITSVKKNASLITGGFKIAYTVVH